MIMAGKIKCFGRYRYSNLVCMECNNVNECEKEYKARMRRQKDVGEEVN